MLQKIIPTHCFMITFLSNFMLYMGTSRWAGVRQAWPPLPPPQWDFCQKYKLKKEIYQVLITGTLKVFLKSYYSIMNILEQGFPNFFGPRATYCVDFHWHTIRMLNEIFLINFNWMSVKVSQQLHSYDFQTESNFVVQMTCLFVHT